MVSEQRGRTVTKMARSDSFRLAMARPRRWFILLALVAGICGLISRSGHTLPIYAATNPIVSENQQAGTDAWQIPDNGDSQADDVSNQIKGYASSPSVNVGKSITFAVTVN